MSPDFPRAHSERSLTTSQPRAFRQDADIKRDAAVRSKQDAGLIKAGREAYDTWMNTVITSQVNSLKANKSIFMADVKSRAALDPNQNNKDKYIKEIDTWNKNATKDMSPEAKRASANELNADTEIAKIQVNGIFQKKVILESGKNLETAMEGYIQGAVSGDSGMSSREAAMTIDDNVRAGIISADEGTRIMAEFDEDVRVGQIDRRVYNDPKGFKDNVKDYEFKDAKERSDKLAKADSIIKAAKTQEKWEVQQIHTGGAETLSAAMLSGQLTHEGIVKLDREGGIDSETAAIFDKIAANKTFRIPKSTKKGEPDYHLTLLKEAGDNKIEALALLKNAARAYGNSGMGTNQYAYYLNESSKILKRRQKGANPVNEALKGAVGALESWAKGVSPIGDAGGQFTKELFSNFVDKLQNGMGEQKAAEEAKSEAVVGAYPDLGNIPEGGELRTDKDGNRAIVYADGTWKEVE